MQREQRDLDCKGNRKCEEQPAPRAGRKVCTFSNLNEVKADVSEVVLCQQRRGHNAHQHEGRANHGVQEELGCCIDALVVTPTTDQEVHRNQNDFEEQEEQEQVEAQERTHDSGFE